MGRKAKVKLWSVTVGGHGHKVTALEQRPGGNLHLRWNNAEKRNTDKRSLGHTDKERAEREARELSGQLLNASRAVRSVHVTVLELLARYEEKVVARKKPSHAADDRRRTELWQHLIGNREARSIDFQAMEDFVHDRRAGRITIPGLTKLKKPRKLSANPSPTTIGADIVFLQSVFNWALKVRLPDGTPLLRENPIRGYQRPRNKNPKQPVATYDRFLKVRAKADEADPQRLFGSFLDLIEGLGWRVSAICQLQRTDIDRKTDDDAPHGRIRKRGDTDKEGVDMWVPLTEQTRAAVNRIIERNPVLGDLFLFPARKSRRVDRPAPWTRFYARDLLARAEKRAELTPIEGGDFHPYRRAWATARKDLPTADVAAVGGWRDLRSLERSYQKSDAQTALKVMTTNVKVRDVGRTA